MKDKILGFMLALIMIILFIIYPFAIWGGKPEGLWWKVERYQKENKEWIKFLILDKNEQIEQIEIIRNQLMQIKLDF